MIINAYLTDGYLDWGKIFVKSYTYHNGSDDKMILLTRNLNNKQIKSLYDLRKNIEIRNIDLDFKKLSKRAKVEKDKLLSYKKETEKVKVSGNNKVWKLMIAGDERIKAIYNLMKEMEEGDHLFHVDIDTYVLGKFDKLIEETKKNDFSTIFRINKQIRRRGKVFRENRATLICVMGFTINKYSKEFMKRWIHYIDKVPPIARKKGYGQTSCYYAVKDISKKYPNFKWGQFRDKKKRLWMNANKGSKSETLKSAIKHFKELKNVK